MAFVDESGGATTWEPGVYQWETTDPVEGGEGGIDNVPTTQLAKRTVYLKAKQDEMRTYGGFFRQLPAQTNISATLTGAGLGKLHLISATAGAAEIILPAVALPEGAAVTFWVLPSTTQAVKIKVGTGVQLLCGRDTGQREIPLFRGDRITFMYCGNIGGSSVATWVAIIDNRQGVASPGTVTAYTGVTPPARWLRCEGQILERAEYPELFAVIGTKFNVPGEGHASGGGVVGGAQFRIPDMRGEFMRGWDNGSEVDKSGADPDNRALGEWVDQAIKEHNHYIDVPNTADPGGSGAAAFFGTDSVTAETVAIATRLNPAGGNAMEGFNFYETRPRNIAFPFIIFTDTPSLAYVAGGGGGGGGDDS